MRGFALIGLQSPKIAANVGGVLRAAWAYGVAGVHIENARCGWVKDAENTPKAQRHMPVYFGSSLLTAIPVCCDLVVVDLVPDAETLVTFQHPTRAMYVFGPEDGTVSSDIVAEAGYRVMVPMRGCMNLAAAVNVVLYDRMAKG